DARDGPTLEMAVNQRMFVRKSGPTTAKPKQTHMSAPKWNDWAEVCGMPTAAIGIQPSASTMALIRNGEYRRMRGVIATEYIAQVRAVATARPSPKTCPENPPDPEATRATPTSETPVAIQKPRPIRSSPTTLATTPMKIGVVPRKSVTVAADVLSIEYTKHSWLAKIMAAAIAMERRSRRAIRNERSRHHVNDQKRAVAAA